VQLSTSTTQCDRCGTETADQQRRMRQLQQPVNLSQVLQAHTEQGHRYHGRQPSRMRHCLSRVLPNVTGTKLKLGHCFLDGGGAKRGWRADIDSFKTQAASPSPSCRNTCLLCCGGVRIQSQKTQRTRPAVPALTVSLASCTAGVVCKTIRGN
jgi:hypothetical protein